VIWGIASIAEKHDIFLVGFVADGARIGFLVCHVIFLNPRIGVELGDLFLVLNCIFG